VAANFDLGTPGLVKNPARSERAVDAVLHAYGIDDVRASDLVRDLSLSQRQRVEIVRALHREPRVLLLDEPTSALSEPEVQWLFGHLREQRQAGVAMVLISHRMSEIRDVCDRVTILRNGQDVGTYVASEITDAEIVKLMLGRSLDAALPRRAPSTEPRRPLLELRGLAVPPQLMDGTLTLMEGEVLGLAGLDGQGQQQVLRALGGASSTTSGEIIKGGQPVSVTTPGHAIEAGIAFVPGDRAREGLLLPMTVARNMSLPVVGRFTKRGLIDEREERRAVVEMASRMELDPTRADTPVGALSGGNQQKVLLGKWLLTDADVVLLDDPTQGVDVGTKHEIGVQIHRIADEGKGVLLYSTDVDELVYLADRVLVFYGGRVAAEFRQPDLDATSILAAVTGHGHTAQESAVAGLAEPIGSARP
jgi:ribose transport system ATP-binding protein